MDGQADLKLEVFISYPYWKLWLFQVFLSTFPWHEAFYKILNHVTELISYHSQDELFRFLQASHTAKVPESGKYSQGKKDTHPF